MNNSSTQAFSHSLTFGLNLAVLTNMLQFMYNKRNRSKQKYVANTALKSHFWIWGPCYFLFLSIFLIMADLTRHLVNDSWRLQNCEKVVIVGGIKKQTCEVHAVMNEYLPTGNLSVFGIVFTVLFTWIGFLLMAIGILWGLDLPRKMYNTYRKARDAHQSDAYQAETSPDRSDPLLQNNP